MLHVLKATGESEAFNEEKLQKSIARAGIPKDLQENVLTHVKTKLYDDIPTTVIYKHIKEFLRSSDQPFASSKYTLKEAIMDLGPTGYPFEDFVASLLEAQGYKTSVRTVLPGKCVSHEIDVIAIKGAEKIMVEAKFHNVTGTKTNVHVALYTKARFDDIAQRHGFTTSWLITNTKITTDAIAYGHCNRMTIISWDFPENESLRDTIEKLGLIPVTACMTLSQTHKVKLLQQGVVLARDIVQHPEVLAELSLPVHKTEDIVAEAKFLLGEK